MNPLIREYNAYYSDPHFGHKLMVEWRPFATVEEMTERMIATYNERVGPGDDVLWLGDCFFGSKVGDYVMPRLYGRKWLLRGNHDSGFSDARFRKFGFEAVHDGHFLTTIAGVPVRISHYPWIGYPDPRYSDADGRYPERRPPREPGIVLLHGHTHETAQLTSSNTVHLGCDAWGHGPARAEAVAALVRTARAAEGA